MTIAKLHDGRKISFPPGTSKAQIQAEVKRMLAPPPKPKVNEGVEKFDRAAAKVAQAFQSSSVSTVATNEKLTKSIEELEESIENLGDMKKVFAGMEVLTATIAEQVKLLNGIAVGQTQGIDAAVSKIMTSNMQGFFERLMQQNTAMMQAHERKMDAFADKMVKALLAPRELDVKRDFRGRVEGATSKVVGGSL